METKTRKTHSQTGGGDSVREIPGYFRGTLVKYFDLARCIMILLVN